MLIYLSLYSSVKQEIIWRGRPLSGQMGWCRGNHPFGIKKRSSTFASLSLNWSDWRLPHPILWRVFRGPR